MLFLSLSFFDLSDHIKKDNHPNVIATGKRE